MDTNIIQVRKNILITQRITSITQTSFTASINNVNFIPDAVIVKMITFNSSEALPSGAAGALAATPYNQVVNIFSDLVNDNWIGSFTDVGSSCPTITHTVQRPIAGQYNFQLLSPTLAPVNYIGDLSIHLEFVKYKEVKEQKVY